MTNHEFNEHVEQIIAEIESKHPIQNRIALPDWDGNSFDDIIGWVRALRVAESLDDVVNNIRKTLQAKGREYTPQAERYSAFRSAAFFAQVIPEDVMNFYKLKHWEWCRANQSTDVDTEKYIEHYGDCLNYTILAFLYNEFEE